MQNKAFIIYRLPGSQEIIRRDFTDISSEKLQFGDVRVEPWCTQSFEEPMNVCSRSTEKDDYIRRLTRLISELKGGREKAVMSRLICGRFAKFEPEELANEYFSKFPDSFCFLFFHPITGYWMGASPELLLEMHDSKSAATRALAGTKPVDDESPWSAKNIEEHDFVVEDILSRLSALPGSVRAEKGERHDLKYAAVRHLCTPIRLESDEPLPVSEIIHSLHPTPAVCGFPREKGLECIRVYEDHPRNCYGGLITVPTSTGPLTYVILRCVHFDTEKWAIYTGSGITHASEADDEWLETEAKATPLVQLLSSF